LNKVKSDLPDARSVSQKRGGRRCVNRLGRRPRGGGGDDKL